MATAFGLDAERVAQLQQQQAFWTSQLPPPGPVVSVPHAPDDPAVVDRLLAALHRDGVVILERAVDLATVSLLRAEVNLHVQHARPGTTEQLGANTKRLGAVVARAGERCYPLVAHPVLMEVCSAVLGQQALNIERADLEEEMEWSCHLTQLIEVGPGAGVQPLHSDGGAWAYDFKREIEHSLSTMWALDDSWTDQGGATRFILGSHRWPPERFGHHEEAVAAAMPAGSLLIFSSAVRHGAGSNTSNKPRLGLNVDYNLQFLRQEEAQQLSNPETINQFYPPHIRRLLNLPPLPSPPGSRRRHRPINWASTQQQASLEWSGHEGLAAVVARTTHAGSGRTWAWLPEHPTTREAAAAVAGAGAAAGSGYWGRRNSAAASAFAAAETAAAAAAAAAMAEANGKTVTAKRVGPVTELAPDRRWCVFQSNLSRWMLMLPAAATTGAGAGPGIVRLSWKEAIRGKDDDGVCTEAPPAASLASSNIVERLLAALHRDGAVVLEDAVPAAQCAELLSDLAPYFHQDDDGEEAEEEDDSASWDESGGHREGIHRQSRAADISGVGASMAAAAAVAAGAADTAGASAVVGAVVARSARSWPLVSHPALLKIAEACVGRQVLDMDASQLQRRTGGVARQCSYSLHRAHVHRQTTTTPPQAASATTAKGTARDDAGRLRPLRASCSSVPFDFGTGFEAEIGAVWGLGAPAAAAADVQHDADGGGAEAGGGGGRGSLSRAFDIDGLGGVPSSVPSLASQTVVLGSHRWSREQQDQWLRRRRQQAGSVGAGGAEQDEEALCSSSSSFTGLPCQQQQMEEEEVQLPAGSVLIYSGRILRGGPAGRSATKGADSSVDNGDRSAVARSATDSDQHVNVLDVGYRAGFLAEDEPQYKANPPELARHYPPHIQRLVGYDLLGTTMGYFGDFQHPLESFDLKLPSQRWRAAIAEAEAAPLCAPTGLVGEVSSDEEEEEEEEDSWLDLGLPLLTRGRRRVRSKL